MMQCLKRGDHVRVRLNQNDEWTRAFVALASDTNPSSVMLMLDAVRSPIGVIRGGLPVSIDYQQETIASLYSDFCEIEVVE